jgi:hypothetical protein
MGLAAASFIEVTVSPGAVDFSSHEMIYERKAHLTNFQLRGHQVFYSDDVVIAKGIVLSRFATGFIDTSEHPVRSGAKDLQSGQELIRIGAGAKELCCFGKIGVFNPRFYWTDKARSKFLNELDSILADGTLEQAEDFEVLIAKSFFPEITKAGTVKRYKTVTLRDIPTSDAFLASWKHDDMTLADWWADGDF